MRFVALAALALISGCSPSSEVPDLTTPADSLAWHITEAAGGLDTWAEVPLLRWDFVVGTDSTEAFRAKHFWNRETGRYRVEWPAGEKVAADSTAVAVMDLRAFNPDAPQGTVALGGVPLAGDRKADQLRAAYERFINDSYWLLAPLKVFDAGVVRTLAPDSNTATERVLRLSFRSVGLTPGDRYWLFADRETGRITGWTFLLEGQDQPAHFRWSEPDTLSGYTGQVILLTRKRNRAGRVIRTETFLPPEPGTLFTTFGEPRL